MTPSIAGRALTSIAITCCMLLGGPASAGERASSAETLNERIENKIAYYNAHYPEIRFLHVDGGEDWHAELVSLITIIGHDPVAMDYQHPPDLREAVVQATTERLRQMLQYDIVSATLFKAGRERLIERPYLCVVTLNPSAYVASDRDATQYMLDVQAEVIDRIHPSRYLDHLQHLDFTLDHEAYHCIDSYRHGGAPMTMKPLGGQYHLFWRESVADAYALAIHIRDHGGITAYARNLMLYRALWLFTDSPNRCTFETVREVLRVDPAEIVAMDDAQIAALAVALRDQAVRPYEGYVRQRATALTAAETLGVAPQAYGDEWFEAKKSEVDPELVESLVNRYRFYYDQLFTDTGIPLAAPPAWEPRAP